MLKTVFRKERASLILALILLSAAIGIVLLNNNINKDPYPPIFAKRFPLSTPVSFFASMLGMRRLATDIVWIQGIQYFGTRKGNLSEQLGAGHKEELKKMYPELLSYWQQVIRFDPMFVAAHLTGPVTLAWNLRRYDEALVLIDEAIASVEAVENIAKADPQSVFISVDSTHPLMNKRNAYIEELKWKLYKIKATIFYMDKLEYDKATVLLEKVAFQEDAPLDLKIILAQLYNENGQYGHALKLWQYIYAAAERINRKENALKHIEELKELISSKR
jgi:tetratricopeptide (TPR) repeat protein